MKKLLLEHQPVGSQKPCLFTMRYVLSTDEEKLIVHCYIEACYPHSIDWLQLRNFTIYLTDDDGLYRSIVETGSGIISSECWTLIRKAGRTIFAREALSISDTDTFMQKEETSIYLEEVYS